MALNFDRIFSIWEEVATETGPELRRIVSSIDKDGYKAGALAVKVVMRGPGVDTHTFNLENPRAVEWFAQNGGTVDKIKGIQDTTAGLINCLLYTSPSPRDRQKSRMPSSA